jgi:two-component system, LytTR family, response regulator
VKKFNCLIVDDEEAAHEVLKNYISRLKYLHVAAHAYDAIEAGEIIKQQEIDIVFLDINMPEISGLEFIVTLKNAPKIILTTAYSEFALDAYDLGVVDYLVKPIPLNRFLKCMHKILPTDNEVSVAPVEEKSIELKIDGVNKIIQYSDVLYFQALGNYIKIVTASKNYLTILTMQELEKKLASKIFVRIHKSFIVPTIQLKNHISFQKIEIGSQEIPIGRSYKVVVQKILMS